MLSETIKCQGSSAWELSAPLSFPYEIKHLYCLKEELLPNDGPMQIPTRRAGRKRRFPAHRSGQGGDAGVTSSFLQLETLTW